LRPHPGGRWALPGRQGRRDPGVPGPQRRRQDHDAQALRGPASARRGGDLDRRHLAGECSARGPRAAGIRSRSALPLRAALGARAPRLLRLVLPGSGGRCRCAGVRAAPGARLDGHGRPADRVLLARDAAEGVDRRGADPRARGAAPRRAALGTRSARRPRAQGPAARSRRARRRRAGLHPSARGRRPALRPGGDPQGWTPSRRGHARRAARGPSARDPRGRLPPAHRRGRRAGRALSWRAFLLCRLRLFRNGVTRSRGGGARGLLLWWALSWTFACLVFLLFRLYFLTADPVQARVAFPLALDAAFLALIAFALPFALAPPLLDDDLSLLRLAPVTTGRLLLAKLLDSIPYPATLLVALAAPVSA